MLDAENTGNPQDFREAEKHREAPVRQYDKQSITQTEDEASGFIEDEDKNFTWSSIGILEWFCILAFWVLAFVVFYQFFTRYFLNDSAVWTEEIARNILIVLTFFGAALALKRHAHISVQFFVSKLPLAYQKKMIWFNSILQSLFFASAIYLCLTVADAMQFQKLMAIDLSRSVIYQSVAVSFVAMLIIEVYRSIKRFRKNDDQSSEDPS